MEMNDDGGLPEAAGRDTTNAKARERTPFGVWAMAGIFGIGLIVLIIMSNIDF